MTPKTRKRKKKTNNNDFKISLVIFTFLMIAVVGISFLNNYFSNTLPIPTNMTKQVVSEEHTDLILNPGRGNSQEIGKISDFTYEFHQEIKIFELSLSLASFSSNSTGDDAPISESFLSNLEAMLLKARELGKQVFTVFSYGNRMDAAIEPSSCIAPNCLGEPNNGLLTVLYHIEQLADILNKFPDVILFIYSGLLGAYGEQHSTPMSSSKNVALVVDKWILETKDYLPSISVSVRTVSHLIEYYNYKLGTYYTPESFPYMNEADENSDLNRVGLWNDVFNDDYYDMGTFYDRSNELERLSEITNHTFYGGETANGYSGNSRNEFNDMNYFEYEARILKPSYLRRFGDDFQEAGLFRNQTYYGNDHLYKGKMSIQKYIERHLGYRFVLRESYLETDIKKNSKSYFKIVLDNVGWNKILIKYKASILIVDQNKEIVSEEKVNIDLDKDENLIYFDVPSLADSTYSLYLKLSKDSGEKYTSYDELNTIELANVDIYDESLKANKIGSFSLSNKEAPTSKNKTKQIATNEVLTFIQTDEYLVLNPGDTYRFKPLINGKESSVNASYTLLSHTGDIKSTTISNTGLLSVGEDIIGSNAYYNHTFKVKMQYNDEVAYSYVLVEAGKYQFKDSNGNILDSNNHLALFSKDSTTLTVTNIGTSNISCISYFSVSGKNNSIILLDKVSAKPEYVAFNKGETVSFSLDVDDSLTSGSYEVVISISGRWQGWNRVIERSSSFKVILSF